MISIIVDKIENLYTPSIIAEAISPICRKLSFRLRLQNSTFALVKIPLCRHTIGQFLEGTIRVKTVVL